MTMYGRSGRPSTDVLAGVVDGDDARVVQRGRGLRLAAEPGLEGGVARQVGAQHLDRDGAAQPRVASPVHLGHAAAAEQLTDLVAVAEESRLAHSVPFPGSSTTRTVPVPGPVVLGAGAPAASEPPQVTARTTSSSTAIPAAPTRDTGYRPHPSRNWRATAGDQVCQRVRASCDAAAMVAEAEAERVAAAGGGAARWTRGSGLV